MFLAFGALHVSSGFDLGQKEMENWTFCIFAAVPNDHHRGMMTRAIESIHENLTFALNNQYQASGLQ